MVEVVDRVQRNYDDQDWRYELDDLVYAAYEVTAAERQLIEDFLGTAVDRHYRGLQSDGFDPPSVRELTSYAEAYADVLRPPPWQ